MSHFPNRLTTAAVTIAALIAAPVASVFAVAAHGGGAATWKHLAATVLWEYVVATAWLGIGTGAGAAVVGVAAAWLVTMHEFRGRRVLEWALVLPLAVPAYLIAYTYTDLLQFAGPVQGWLRATFALRAGEYWFPDVRSVGGAVAMFVLVLYPYVYLLARATFLEHAIGMTEVARSLGLGPWRAFFRTSLPLARPAIATGVALVVMETFADYGTVAYFGVLTFTTGIYRAWFSLGDRVASAQLSTSLLAAVVLLLVTERASRGRARFHDTTPRRGPHVRRALEGWRAALAVGAVVAPLTLGFVVPAGVLVRLALVEGDAQFGLRFARLAANSFTLAAVTAVIAVGASLLVAYAVRRSRSAIPRAASRLVALGYAVPGSVIAVGVLIPVTQVDHWLAGLIETSMGIRPGLLLTGGMVALVYAYLTRFLSVGLQTVDAALTRITPRMDEAARSLGSGDRETLWRVHLPLLRGGILTAGLLVFVDVMKELPATLVMRPFGFDTLATQVYQLASDERLAEASTSALAIVAVGILPLIAISREIARTHRG